MTPESFERKFMQEAVQEMGKSVGSPKVGAVLVIDGKAIAAAHKQDGIHAERGAIEAALNRGFDLAKAVLYTTLEPCVDLSTGQEKLACADLIISAGIQSVVIGRYDPNPTVYRKGWKRLHDAGIRCRDFPQELRDSIDAINRKFMCHFTTGVGPAGGAKIDHKDRATFRVKFSCDDHRYMDIGWTLCDGDAAYGFAVKPVEVALVRFATDFDDIDDPTAYDFGHSARIGVGEIGIFRGPDVCVLVKLKAVQSGPGYGAKDYFVHFDYRVRVLRSSTDAGDQ